MSVCSTCKRRQLILVIRMTELEASDWKLLRIRRVYQRRWMMAIVIPGGKRMLPSKFDDIIISWLLIKCHRSLGHGWRKKSKHNPTGGTAFRRIDLFNVFPVDRTISRGDPERKMLRTSVLPRKKNRHLKTRSSVSKEPLFVLTLYLSLFAFKSLAAALEIKHFL